MARRKPKAWRDRFAGARPPHVVTPPSDFAGVKAGMTMPIASPAETAAYLAAIPRGQTRSMARLRGELARRAGADATCPVTAAIFVRVVAEAALEELAAGAALDAVTPFWRVLAQEPKIAAGLSCGRDGVENLARLEAAADA